MTEDIKSVKFVKHRKNWIQVKKDELDELPVGALDAYKAGITSGDKIFDEQGLLLGTATGFRSKVESFFKPTVKKVVTTDTLGGRRRRRKKRRKSKRKTKRRRKSKRKTKRKRRRRKR